MYDELLNKLQPMSRDEVEAYWPEVDSMRDTGKITPEEYKDLCDYCFTP